MPNQKITHYSDYRLFLKEVYEARKLALGKYSFRQFSDDLGFAASNFIHLVVTGKRNLSEEACRKIAKHFKWKAVEKKYFKELVLFNQAKSQDDKEKHKQVLQKILGKKRALIGSDQFNYFSHWYLPVLREMVALKNFVSHLNWISKTLKPKVDENLVKDGLALLERMNMIKRVKNKWVQVEEHLTTPVELNSSMVHNYHKEMLKLSANALNMNADERDISAMTMSLSVDQFEKVKKRVIDFRDELQQELQDDSKDHTMVAQLNIQLFPVAKSK